MKRPETKRIIILAAITAVLLASLIYGIYYVCCKSYPSCYNDGNKAYEEGRYQKAEDLYRQALNANPPHKGENSRECDIRINLALAILNQINFDKLDDENDIDKALDLLRMARGILTEEGCAGVKDPDGHDPESEQLKKEIDEMIKELENKKNNGSSDQNDEDSDDSDQPQTETETEKSNSSDSNSREDSVRNQLERERQAGYEDMRHEQQRGGGGESEDGDSYGGGNW